MYPGGFLTLKMPFKDPNLSCTIHITSYLSNHFLVWCAIKVYEIKADPFKNSLMWYVYNNKETLGSAFLWNLDCGVKWGVTEGDQAEQNFHGMLRNKIEQSNENVMVLKKVSSWLFYGGWILKESLKASSQHLLPPHKEQHRPQNMLEQRVFGKWR